MTIVAIIVTYNGSAWINKCINSVLESEIPVRVIVVDNNSSDNTVQIVQSNFPEVIIFQNTDNLGFGKANNIGMKFALNANAEYVFLLNQDAWVEKKAIRKLLEISLKFPEYILSPVHLNSDGSELESGFASYVPKNVLGDIINPNDEKEIFTVKFVNAAFWLIPVKCLEKVGGFDPLFFHYEEDVDFLNRAQFHGFKVAICPNAVGYHSRKRVHSDKDYFSYSGRARNKNICLVILKNINSNLLTCTIAFFRYFIKKNIKNLIQLNFKRFLSDYSVIFDVIGKLPIIIRHRRINKTLFRSFL